MPGGADIYGQDRVNSRERNNRRSDMAKGDMSKTPRKKGAQSGFGSNKIKSRKGIMGKPRP